MWRQIRKDVDLEPETELSDNVYLVCNQRVAQPDLQWLNAKNELFKKLTIHASKSSAMSEGNPCNDTAGDRSDKNKKVQNRQAPGDKNVPVGGDSSVSSVPYPPADIRKARAWNYDMIGHAEQCVQRWCELAKKEMKDLPVVGTPGIDDHNLQPEDFVSQ